MSASRLVNRNVIAGGVRTSMRLEPELWDALREIGEREKQPAGRLLYQIEDVGYSGGRTSAVRVFIMGYYRSAATELGHAAAGHGKSRSVEHQDRSLTQPPPAS
jgi:predicted DNA-binding ribbon-helix-helix protein